MEYNRTSPVIAYFGKDTVEDALRDFFIENGATSKNLQIVRTMSTKAPDEFFELVSAYVENSSCTYRENIR